MQATYFHLAWWLKMNDTLLPLSTPFIVLCLIIERDKTPLRVILVPLIVYQLSIHLFPYLIFHKFPRFI